MRFIERIRSFHVGIGGSSKHINILGHGGTLPPDLMKAGIILYLAPHAIITLLGEFKGELGFKYHLCPWPVLQAWE
jgi:hypothetical protein